MFVELTLRFLLEFGGPFPLEPTGFLLIRGQLSLSEIESGRLVSIADSNRQAGNPVGLAARFALDSPNHR